MRMKHASLASRRSSGRAISPATARAMSCGSSGSKSNPDPGGGNASCRCRATSIRHIPPRRPRREIPRQVPYARAISRDHGWHRSRSSCHELCCFETEVCPPVQALGPLAARPHKKPRRNASPPRRTTLWRMVWTPRSPPVPSEANCAPFAPGILPPSGFGAANATACLAALRSGSARRDFRMAGAWRLPHRRSQDSTGAVT